MAKKWLALGLFLLLLTGCAAAENEKLPVTEDMVGVIESPEGSLYVPASAIEEQTAGNVKVFALQGTGYRQMYWVGDDLLVMNDTHMIAFTSESPLSAFASTICAPSTYW